MNLIKGFTGFVSTQIGVYALIFGTARYVENNSYFSQNTKGIMRPWSALSYKVEQKIYNIFQFKNNNN